MSRRQVNTGRKVFYLFSIATVINLTKRKMELKKSNKKAFKSHVDFLYLLIQILFSQKIHRDSDLFSSKIVIASALLKPRQYQIQNNVRRFSQQH